MNYYISDLHFFCQDQTQEGPESYAKRPFANVEEMNAYMLDRWNRKVTDKDTVYILGDIAHQDMSEPLLELIARLRGKKVLIAGNHDNAKCRKFKKLFEEVCDYKEIRDVSNGKNYSLALFHYPILMWCGQHKGKILLYGHTHSTAEDDFFQRCLQQLPNLTGFTMKDGRKLAAYNVGCMKPYMDYEPRTLEEIIAKRGCVRFTACGRVTEV